MFLIKTALEGTKFSIQFIKGQANTAPEGIDIDTTQIGSDISVVTKYPLGTVFIAEEMKWGTLTSQTAGYLYPVFNTMDIENINVYSTGVTADHLGYVIDTMLVNKDYGSKMAIKVADTFKHFGVVVDVESRLAKEGISATGTLRDRIIEKYPCPSIADIGFHIQPEVWYLLIRNVLKGDNTLLIGPTGSGKTEVVEHIANAMKTDLFYQDMGTIQDAQSALLGVHRLNKDGVSEFDYAPFVDYVQRPGIILLDELNRAPLASSNILFPCLDRRRYLPLDIAGHDSMRKVPVHQECVFFATANLGAEYTGTTQIDRALMDRFFPIELSYPEQDTEIKILMNRTGVVEKQAKAIVRVSNTIREQFKAQELSNVVSVRHSILTANLIKDGFDTVAALMQVIMPLFEDSDGVSERTKVKSIIAAN